MSKAWTVSFTPSSRDLTWSGKPAPSTYLHKQLDVTLERSKLDFATPYAQTPCATRRLLCEAGCFLIPGLLLTLVAAASGQGSSLQLHSSTAFLATPRQLNSAPASTQLNSKPARHVIAPDQRSSNSIRHQGASVRHAVGAPGENASRSQLLRLSY